MFVCSFVGSLLNVPATCECISGTDVLNVTCEREREREREREGGGERERDRQTDRQTEWGGEEE